MHKRISVFIVIVFLINTFFTTTAQNLTIKEKEWLAKASRIDQNGWVHLHIEGRVFERGFQRGYLTANKIDDFFKTIAYQEKFETAKEINLFVKSTDSLFKEKVTEEYVQEMNGIVAGMEKAGKKINYEEMLFMNGLIDVLWHWWLQEKGKVKEPGPGCSAFIATGDATADGKVVMVHNSWYFYTILRFCNQIVEIIPDKGHRILMQSWGPCLYGTADFFITGAGLIGTETTIGNFSSFNPEGTLFLREQQKPCNMPTTSMNGHE